MATDPTWHPLEHFTGEWFLYPVDDRGTDIASPARRGPYATEAEAAGLPGLAQLGADAGTDVPRSTDAPVAPPPEAPDAD